MNNDSDTFPPDRKPADHVEHHPDERDEGTPEPPPPAGQQEPAPQPGQAGTVLDLKAEPEKPGTSLMKAAESVPVARHGAAPENFANQVTLAQYMAKAQLMVPQHFHGNVGDCLAIIDIAQRAGLSPYMVAAKTYKDPKGKGIAFESQLYHAMLIGSGWLKDSALHVDYEGTGEARTCTVWGTLRNEIAPRYYTSPPLKDLLPAKNEAGVYKGSPLWGDKPDVQMFYDTTRDWGRMFCPIATLGMLAQYESIEHPLPAPGAAGDTTLRDRIQGTKEGDEGHRNGHAERELAATAADRGTITPANDPSTITPGGAKAKTTTKKKPAAHKTPEPEIKASKPTAAQKAAAAKKAASAAADRAQATSDKNKAKQPTAAPKVPATPKTDAEYQVYCIDWINKTADPEAALKRWNDERDLREQCGCRIAMKNDLRFRIETKHGV